MSKRTFNGPFFYKDAAGNDVLEVYRIPMILRTERIGRPLTRLPQPNQWAGPGEPFESDYPTEADITPYRYFDWCGNSDVVIVVENEIEANELWAKGLNGTALPHWMSYEPRRSYLKYFTNRDVVVWPEPFESDVHRRQVKEAISNLASVAHSVKAIFESVEVDNEQI